MAVNATMLVTAIKVDNLIKVGDRWKVVEFEVVIMLEMFLMM
jgi:hypothetical protein